MRVRGRCAALILAASFVVAAEARAGETSDENAAAAESLFQEARKLIDAKRYSEACPKLVASHNLAPAVGTLLNLADCYEHTGQLASAWTRFQEALVLAQRLGRPDREKTARDRAERLEPRLIKLTITPQEPGLEVRLDGAPIEPSALGTPLPVDAGKHTLEASAKGKKPFSTTFEVSEQARTPNVEIPRLESESEGKPAPLPVEKEQPPPATSHQRTLGLVAMGVGGAGALVGTFFGLRTSSKWSDAQEHCVDLACDETGVELAQAAKTAGTISTISFVASGVLLAGGAVLFFTADAAKKKDLSVGVGPGSMLVRGTF